MEPDRRSLQTLFAFAYGMQVGRMRRIAAELQKLAQQAQLATMAAGAAIAIAAQNQIECIARSGGAAPQLGSKPEATVGLSGECIRTGIPQFCADTETHPFVDRMHSRTFGVRSIVYVPLFRGVQPSGVIGVFSDKAGHFTQHDMRVLQLIGREVTKTLKWEPHPNAVFAPPSSVVVTPPEAEAVAASAGMAEIDPLQALDVPPTETPVADPVLNVDITRDKDENDAIVAQAEELLKESSQLAEEGQSLPVMEVVAEPITAEAVEEDQEVTEEPARVSIADEDYEYPARVPNFLFNDEHEVPRWMLLAGAVVVIAVVFGSVWWLMPLWAPKEEPTQMVYGPPQVTRDAATGQPETTQGTQQSGPGANINTLVPGTKPEGLVAATTPSTYVKTVTTQVSGGHTFVSILLSGRAQFQAHELTNPDRIYIDLHGVEVSPEMKDAKIAGVGPIADFRFSKSPDNVTRLVLVLDAPCTYLVSVTSDPYVIVFDVQPLRIPRPGAAKRKAPESPGL